MAGKTPVTTILGRIFILLLALAIGVAIVVTFVSRKQPPARITQAEQARPVRVLTARPLPLTLTAQGFGSARPAESWSAVSSVKGPIVYLHPDLESGALMPAGTLLVQIDPASYKLALAEAEADLAGVKAQIAQLQQEAANAKILLKIEQQRLELAEADLARTQNLVDSGAAAQSALDTQLRATLAQRKVVQSLLNQQALVPIQLRQLQAQQDRVTTKRATAERNLADTEITAPFDLRISDVKVTAHQNINPGQLLFSGDATEAAEVVLQVPMPALRRLVSALPDSGGGTDVSGLKARVALPDGTQVWPADVSHIANGLDPATRTVPVVLRVQQPGAEANPLDNPPLPKGMYVEGRLTAPAPAPRLVLPRAALHEGWLYLVGPEDRLQRRQVSVAFEQDGLVVIDEGLEEGAQVILDDIVPAIEGMALSPAQDAQAAADLATRAAGGKQ